MRFTSITFGLVAFLTASAVAAPTPNTNDVAKRMPTPEQFEALAPEEKREAYKAIYRATNIIGKVSENEWMTRSLLKRSLEGVAYGGDTLNDLLIMNSRRPQHTLEDLGTRI
ncbi:uncharacterized protein ALTATR162_LOCUS6964 [Alternaria atra]|uniref:RxLR effector protein n=1 Tax=Alternaria atra TaxID=119953 RepID=A0A8J2I7P7_9PLEO|nr:uncharacterized protein ALTATR162_LOCUS6964 [Alternaria atra]CAG5166693.1 unnamed protein product [Alternaria atra]